MTIGIIAGHRPYGRPGQIARVLKVAAYQDRHWMGRIASAGDEQHTPWMPFSVPAFIELLAQAVSEATGDRFLEIGCGIGTKMMIAREIFGLDVYGFDRVAEYVTECLGRDLRASVEDAGNYGDYGNFDIIWFNRTYRDRGLQAALEQTVWEQARPGTVIMCANLESPPPPSWLIIDDDWEARRGVWQKPYAR